MCPDSGEDPPTEAVTLEQALALAVGWQREGRLDAAEPVYRQILAVLPDQPDALHFLGLLEFQRGHEDAALEWLARAVAVAPGHAGLRSNHGNVLQTLGRLDEAEREYRAALAAEPALVAAWNNLGVVLHAAGRRHEAIEAYRHALELEASSAADHHRLATLLERCHEYEAAAVHHRAALALDPQHLGATRALGHALSRLGRLDEAAAAYRAWLALEPGHPLAELRLAACGGAPAPARCSDAVVRGLFDQYAGHFDAHLRGTLDYHAPERLADALALVLDAPAAALDVLDAGCGTGLCGPLLRPYARQLSGVDLSPKMLEQAASLALYDALETAELCAWLNAHPGAFDLLVAADTLCYFGPLADFAAAAAAALRPGGWLAFTLETHTEALDHRLNACGRYSHAPDYPLRVLAGAGFGQLRSQPVVLRRERGAPVEGLVVLARRPATPGYACAD